MEWLRVWLVEPDHLAVNLGTATNYFCLEISHFTALTSSAFTPKSYKSPP